MPVYRLPTPGNAILGLRRHTVRLVQHDPRWAEVYADVAAHISLWTSLAAERIAHVGSTAVQGIRAKPILDVAIRADSIEDADEIAARLAANGFIDRGVGEGSIGRLLLLEPEPEVRAVHVHIVGEAHWKQYHDFLDGLRRDAKAMARYSEEKERLARAFAHDRAGYTAAKAAFVSAVLESGP